MAEEKNDVSFAVVYFPFGGRAAPLRAAASLGGLSYEERFVSFDEHKADKAAGKRRWGGLPEMIVFDKDGKELATIGQSNACLRYVGSLTGLYPENPLERALVDEVLDSVEDVIGLVGPSMHEQDADKKKAMRLALMGDDKLPYWLNKFETRLEENEKRGNKSGYFVGDKVSIADLKFYFLGQMLTSGQLDHIEGDKLLAPNKRISGFIKALSEHDGIKKFTEEFAKSQKENKDNKTTKFKIAGKASYGSF